MSLVLMYHGVYGDAHPLSAIKSEDRPYALSREAFADQLAALSGQAVQITFDDGDLGWALYADALLTEHGCHGLFFVTPALIGTPGYCSWDQLRTLVQHGHRIGTHGLTHSFLPDLDDAACAAELVESKRQVEAELGIEVTTLSFPGGRYGARELRLARDAGYYQCYTSEPGRASAGRFTVPRIAVRTDTSLGWLQKMVDGHWLSWWKLTLVHQLKRWLKKILGNRGYHELYRVLRG